MAPSPRLRLAAFLLVLTQPALPVSAQAIDPEVLQSLQGQLGSSINRQARQHPDPEPQSTSGDVTTPAPGAHVDTYEEQQVRRAEARRALADLYVPSPVESDYRQRLKMPELRQFGYEFFHSGPSPSGIRSGAIGDDYILGIGDEVEVSFRGASNSTEFARVDRDGRLIVGELPPIQAAGRTLGSLRAEIAAETKRTLLATDVYVSVGDVRSISLFVGGEVERPGQYSITSVSDIATLLAKAGGVRRNGSLRQVRLVRAGGGSQTVDLYGLLGIGAPPNIQLRDGDRVIVPVIGPTVAITGAVPRPGIYELRSPASIDSVVAYAGGGIRQRGVQVVISRIGTDGQETFVRASGANERIIGGDAIQLIDSSPGGATGRVELLGNVGNPGPRPLVAAGTIAELVGRAEDLRPDTYQAAAMLLRRDPMTGARVFQPINLAQELRGITTTTLKSEDRLVILSRDDIAFMNSVPVRQIVLGQPNPMEDCDSLVALAALVRDTKTARFSAVTRGGQVFGQGAGEQTCPAIFERITDLLPILLEHSISVGGAVRRPGAYPIAGSVSARDVTLLAEGLVTGATDLSLDINRGGREASQPIEVDPSGSALALTNLSAGDDIRFNAEQPLFENAGVLLSGEVMRPGLYAIRRGETMSQLLERAGGLRDQAYAYGTVFTRRSVRESQEAGFRRTARELNNSLLALAARSTDGGGGDLTGAAALIQTLAEAEAPGRMVVEADPRVLAIRPDLDTVLEAGDAIHVPRKPNFVLALGDVHNPGALQFSETKAVETYLNEAGGMLSTADRKRVFMVLPNGTAQPVMAGGWSGRGSSSPPPGTVIIVPKNIDPLYKLSVFRDITAIIAQLATSVGTVAVLATR